MKYKYTLVLVAMLLSGSVGCQKDYLNSKIDTYATPATIITNRGTLFSFGNAFYTPLVADYGFNVNVDKNLFAAATDEAQQTASPSSAQIYNEGGLNPGNNPEAGLYKNYYDGIRAANFFLNYSLTGHDLLTLGRDTVTDVTAYHNDLQNLKWYRAEAHIARAYYYAELIKRWGGVPIINTTLDQAGAEYVPKSTYDEVVAYIVSEIDNNKADLQVNWKTSNFATNDGRFTLGAALAIKARVLLYAASPLHNPSNDVTKWQAAATAAYDIINNDAAHPNAKFNYALDNNYGAYFTGLNTVTSNETIFAIRQSANHTPESLNYPIGTAGGSSGVCPSDNLVSDYEYLTGAIPNPALPYNDRDPRLAASIVYNGSTWNGRTIVESAGGTDDITKANTSKTGYYLKKLLTDNLNLVQNGTNQHQWAVYRYAEILLDYAEAMNEAYGPDNANGYKLSARQALKMVRDRASMALPVVNAGSVSSFRDALKHERRIELAFENHRYWDLIRWNDAMIVLNQPIKGVKVTQSGGAYAYTKVNVATRVFNTANSYYPFSQAEISNSKGTLVQNPNY